MVITVHNDAGAHFEYASCTILDKDRLISHAMGEHDRGSVVWDYIAVYPAGAVWEERPPQALYDGGPVVRVIDETRTALAQASKGEKAQQGGFCEMRSAWT